MTRARPLIWLLPALGALLVVLVYRDVYASEAGRYAGAEPEIAGLWVASPLILLVLTQVLGALAMHVSTTDRGRAASTAAVLAAALATLAVAFALLAA